MAQGRSSQKSPRDPGKTHSIRFRFLATVILSMLAITVFIGGLSIYEVDSYVQDQAKTFVSITCTNEGEQINNSLKNMEKSVKIMESYLMEFFKDAADVSDRALQEKIIENADKMFLDVASTPAPQVPFPTISD